MKVPDIWVTIGQRGFNEKNLVNLLQYDIAGIRINTGRSTYPWIYDVIKHLTKLGYPLENIILDIGNTKPRLFMGDKNRIVLRRGDLLTISNQKRDGIIAWISNPYFFEKIQKKDIVYFGDGEFEGTVEEARSDEIALRVLTEGTIGEAVSVGIKGKDYFRFCIPEEEKTKVNCLLEKYPVKLIVSFIENRNNIWRAQEQFPKAISIIPKIETCLAVDGIDDILQVVDWIFIGRGDLGLSMGVERVGIIQKKLVDKAHQVGCRVSVGTGTLDSLKWNEVPLRAEIIDITNSCLSGIDVIALTSETGGSEVPFKAIEYLVKTINYIKTVDFLD